MIVLITLIQYFPRDPNQGNKAGKRKRGECIQIEKEEINVFIFEDNISIYVQNIKETTKWLLDLINEFNKVSRHRSKIFLIGFHEQLHV